MKKLKDTLSKFLKVQLTGSESKQLKGGAEKSNNPLYSDPQTQGNNPLHGGK